MNHNLINLFAAPLAHSTLLRMNANLPAEMHVDVRENDKSFVITADVPGVPRGNLSVELSNNVLTIATTATDDSAADEASDSFILRERHCGYFSRSFKLPQPVVKDDIDAKLEAGVLTITVPKPDAEVIKREKHVTIK